MKKPKVERIWTPKQRAAAAERMRVAQAKRWARPIVESPDPIAVESNAKPIEEPIQGRYEIGDQTVVFTPNHTIILEKKDETPPPPGRMGSRNLQIIVRTDGQMVSEYGPCLCGAKKREWHKICLREVANAKE